VAQNFFWRGTCDFEGILWKSDGTSSSMKELALAITFELWGNGSHNFDFFLGKIFFPYVGIWHSGRIFTCKEILWTKSFLEGPYVLDSFTIHPTIPTCFGH